MLNKEKFDSIIKNNLIEATGYNNFGYELSNTYDNYYNRQTFDDFLQEMQQPRYRYIYDAYGEGKGSELKEQTGRYGTTPPKMACVASSSRFCYLALRDGAQCLGTDDTVRFEHECRIKGISGTAPQLDAYIADGNIYIEAKCHEIFDDHKIKMKAQYWDYIYGCNNKFGFTQTDKLSPEEFEIPFSAFGLNKTSAMFDVKQFLCHLLGIASQKEAEEPATLIYMFYKPLVTSTLVQEQIEEIFIELQDEIIKLFGCDPIRKFTQSNNIKLMAIAECAKIMEPLSSQNMTIIAKS